MLKFFLFKLMSLKSEFLYNSVNTLNVGKLPIAQRISAVYILLIYLVKISLSIYLAKHIHFCKVFQHI